jgi:hypothetical protein
MFFSICLSFLQELHFVIILRYIVAVSSNVADNRALNYLSEEITEINNIKERYILMKFSQNELKLIKYSTISEGMIITKKLKRID